jgi:hypothetical protein
MNFHFTPSAEEEWARNLVLEAARDLVFLWHITSGSFGGPSGSATKCLAAQENAISALLAADCKVGFGDPDSKDWRVPEEMLGDAKINASKILQLHTARPEEYRFLVFAVRR